MESFITVIALGVIFLSLVKITGIAGSYILDKLVNQRDEEAQARMFEAVEVSLPPEELVYDHVSLEKAEFIESEKQLLDKCNFEQFLQLTNTNRPVKLGYFFKEDWSGGLPFYLFKCPNCAAIGVDYKHGHRPSLFCEECHTGIYFNSFFPISRKRLV